MMPHRMVGGVATLLVCAACSPSAAPPYAARVAVSGDATPIKDLSYDQFFEQSFDDACRITTTEASPDLALAGPAGSTISLDVTMSSCGQESPPPEMACSWKVVPRANVCAPKGAVAEPGEGHASWSGWSHQALLQVPDRTGIYDVTLACEVEGGEAIFEPIETTLYATYRAPLFMVSPPQRNWYERATDWGCGFRAAADERQVLKQILASAYAYGRSSWRYGVFKNPAPGTTPYPPYDEGGGWFNCPWQALVDEGDPCNFADCFEFSQVFEHMSATLGIGVFEPIGDVGGAGEGFKTVADSYSLDPRFPGNIDCNDPGCDGYLFGSHSLRLRDNTYYDTTFNKTYDAAGAFIQASVDVSSHGRITFLDSNLTLEKIGPPGYGTWDQWRTNIQGPSLTPALLLQAPPLTATTIAATVTQTMLGVVVNVNVSLEKAGTYVVRALLGRPGGGDGTAPSDWIPAARPGTSAFSDSTITAAAPGDQQLSLSFGYPAIESAGGAGRHGLRIEVFELRPAAGGATESTLVATFEDSVDVTQAQLDGAKGADIVGDLEIADSPAGGIEGQQTGHFVARYRLSIPPPDPGPDAEGDLPGPTVRSYTLQARLAHYPSLITVAYAGDEFELDEGEHTVSLEIPLPVVADPSVVEHFELTTELIANRDGYWFEDSVAFRRLGLDLLQGEMRPVQLEALRNPR